MAKPFMDDPSRGEWLYQTLKRHCGLDEWRVDAEIELMSATAKEATELQVREGRPLLSLKLTLISENGAFGFTHVRFLAERFHFHFGFLEYPISAATLEADQS
jgi:DNA-binding GntR family transcriptional regulator